MGKLSENTLHKLYEAAIEAGLASSRTTLVGGVDPNIRESLPSADNPSVQLLSDIQKLNDIETADGSSPLLSWLKVAHSLTTGLKQGQVFNEAIAELNQAEPSSSTAVQSASTSRIVWRLNIEGHFKDDDLPQVRALITKLHTILEDSDIILQTQKYTYLVFESLSETYARADRLFKSGHLRELAGFTITKLSSVVQGNVFQDPIAEFESMIQPTSKTMANAADPNIGKPPPRNIYFEGRKALLKDLHTALQTNDRATLTQAAIAGLGGIGKTSLAAEYVHRHKEAYTLVWWLNADDETALETDFTALAVELHNRGNLPKGVVRQTVPEQVNVVKRWLMQHEGWLLVFDNANAPDTLKPYLVDEHQGHIIVTSRHSEWDDFMPSTLTIPVMERHESIALLQNRSGLTDKKHTKSANTLAHELGDLPLALTQAAAYIKTRCVSFAKYLKMFQAKRQTLLAKPGPPRDYPDTVATTWALSFEEIEKERPASAQCLNLMAFLAPADIPLFLFTNGSAHLPDALRDAALDEEELLETLWVLGRHSLIEVHKDIEGSLADLSVHRLVQAVVRDAVDERWAAYALWVVQASYPINAFEYEHWPLAKRLLEHAQTVVEGSQNSNACDDVRSSLLTRVGQYLESQGQFAQAKMAHEQALEFYRKICGEEHPSTLTSMGNLASTLKAQGDLNGARQLQEKGLKIQIRVLGLEHLQTLTYINNLASTLFAQGDLNGARELEEKGLEIQLRTLGPEHLHTLPSINNLAQTLKAQGDLSGARELEEKGLKVQLRVLGPEHPSTLMSINNLAQTLKAQGDLNGARQLQEETLKVQLRVLGPEHPDTLMTINNLALTLKAQGDLNGARELQQKNLEVSTRVLGPEHPSTLTSMNNLADTLFAQGDLNGARELQQKALEVITHVLGPEHPDTLMNINNLALTLQAQGDLNRARELQQKNLQVRTYVLGPTHESTTISQWNLLRTLIQTEAPPQDIRTLRQSLTWLLQAPDHTLSANQRTVRDMLSKTPKDSQI